MSEEKLESLCDILQYAKFYNSTYEGSYGIIKTRSDTMYVPQIYCNEDSVVHELVESSVILTLMKINEPEFTQRGKLFGVNITDIMTESWLADSFVSAKYCAFCGRKLKEEVENEDSV